MQKTLKIVPRQQNPMKMEIILRSQGYDLMYRHIGEEGFRTLMGSGSLEDLIARGFKFTRSMVMLGGQHVSWTSNDIGLPVGIDLSAPKFARQQLFDENLKQPNKFISRSMQALLDLNSQTISSFVFYNPLGVSQGISKVRGSRIHLPANVLVGYSSADGQLEIKMNTTTQEKPLSYMFKSKTVVSIWGRNESKAVAYLEDTCPQCESNSLVTLGEQFRKGIYHFKIRIDLE